MLHWIDIRPHQTQTHGANGRTLRANGQYDRDGEILGTHRVLARFEEETRGEVALQVGHHAGPLEPTSNLLPLAREASGLPASPSTTPSSTRRPTTINTTQDPKEDAHR